MVILRTNPFENQPSEELLVDFGKKTITKGGKKYHLVKVESMGIGFIFVALVYDTYSNRNFYMSSTDKILYMAEKI